MGLLRQMARGIHFDGVGELTNTEAEIHRVFFIKYMPVLTRLLYPLYVSMPSTEEELAKVEQPYEKTCFAAKRDSIVVCLPHHKPLWHFHSFSPNSTRSVFSLIQSLQNCTSHPPRILRHL